MLELLFLLILAGIISVFLWYQSFQEFTILQIDYQPSIEIPTEKNPIVLRGIPREFLGFWRSGNATQSSLPVLYDGGRRRTTLKEFVSQLAKGDAPIWDPLSATELATRFNLHSRFQDTMMFLTRWSHLPVRSIFAPAALWCLGKGQTLGLQRSLAERTVLTVHEGKAIVWLARETISVKEIQTILGRNPWALSVFSYPFINELQYVEVVLRTGTTLLLPPRSLYAIRSESDMSYVSSVELHSPLSFFINSLSIPLQRPKIQESIVKHATQS